MRFVKLQDSHIYVLARGYLPGLGVPGVTTDLIEKYLDPLSVHPKPNSKEKLYQRLLESAQNRNMSPNVIGKAIGGVDKLSEVLEGFNPGAVLSKYRGDSEAVLRDIETFVKPRGTIPKGDRSIWPLYCRTILSAAEFLEQFSGAADFYWWLDFFARDDRARAGLPLLLSEEIKGFGFALSCDFLKELGYTDFPRPDIHLREIFEALDLSPSKASDLELTKAIIRLARHAEVTPYNADKVFWLIGSGDFYDDPQIGDIGSKKKEFIAFAKERLLEGAH